MASLNAIEQQRLKTASRHLVVNALAQVINSHGGPWLPPGHPTLNGIDDNHAPTGASPLTPAQLAEYLALAALNHGTDGWSYLSRALNSYLQGDPHSAWHFAYYAELRAAQSILSASGCGIFNGWNSVIDTSGAVVQVDARSRPLGTHSMVWLALPVVLAFSPGGKSALSSSAEILGQALADLVAYAFPGQGASQTATRWITDWTYDISLGIDDKLFRNRCSYNPHLVTPHSADIGDAVSFIKSFWTSFEPSPGAYFLDLDKHLLRRALIDQAREKLNLLGNANPSPAEISAEVGMAYDRMCASAPPLSAVARDFFTQALHEPNELLLASSDSNHTPTNPRPALSRAALLLRMATGTSRRLLIEAGYQRGTELDFWLSKLAEDLGLVRSYSEVSADRSALYSDCSVAVQDLLQVFDAVQPPVLRSDIINHIHVRSHVVCEATRIAHWGLQP